MRLRKVIKIIVLINLLTLAAVKNLRAQGPISFDTEFKKIKSEGNDSLAIISLKELAKSPTLTPKQRLHINKELIIRAWETQQYPIAIEKALEGEALAHKNQQDSLEAFFIKALGVTYYYLERKQECIGFFEKALVIAHENALWELEASCYNNIGGALNDLKRFDEAESYLKKAIEILTAHGKGNTTGALRSMRVLARIYSMNGKPEEAEKIYIPLIEKTKAIKDTVIWTESLMWYSVDLAKRGEAGKAVEMSAQALAFIRAKNNNYELKTALDVHGLNLYAAGRYQEAYQVARESVNLLKRIFVNDLEKETSLVEIRYKTAQLIQEKQLAELKAKKQRQVYLFSLIGFVLIIGSGFSLWSYRKNAKQKMLLQKQKLEAIIEGEEKERTRIAKDLHDGIVQNLTAIKLKLNEELADPAKIQESKASISSEIDRAAKEVRAIAYQMMPIALQQFGLVAALHDLMQKLLFPKGIKFEFDAVNIDNPEGSFEKEGRLPAKIEICLYRASQELLTNILKHSQASSVSFALTRRNNIVTLICEDNGKGFDETTIQKGIGMNSLVSRLEIVGGTIKFEHPENSGTIVYLTIPLG